MIDVGRERGAPNRRVRSALSVAALILAAARPAEAQILTADAGVRSPELPSVRVLSFYRRYDHVDDLLLRTEAVFSPSTTVELKAVLPLVSRRIEVAGVDEDLRGVADASLQAKVALARADGVMRSDRLSVHGRAILPTGSTDETANGMPLARRLQLGLGSWGFGVGVGATLVRDRHRASVVFDWEHRGAHDGFEPGEQLRLDTAWWFRLSPARFDPRVDRPEWRAVVELRSRYSTRDRGGGASVHDRGAQADGVLGVQVNTGTALRGEVGLVVPVFDELRDPFGDSRFGVIAGLTLYF